MAKFLETGMILNKQEVQCSMRNEPTALGQVDVIPT